MTVFESTAHAVTRRKALACLGKALALSAASGRVVAASTVLPHRGPGMPEKPYDLLIKGGRVIDPAQDLDAPRDVAVRKGKIARVEASIPESTAQQVIRAEGKIVTPGLIDLHTHVLPYVGPYGIDPDPYFVTRGTTSVVDAGTAGAFTLAAFRRFVLERAATRIRVLLHVVSIGLVAGGTPNLGELEDLRYCDPRLAAQAANDNKDIVVGFKIRFSERYTGPNDLEAMRRARIAADDARLPLMIHIGGSYSPLKEFLARLRKGDVVTHTFNIHRNGVLDAAGKVLPEVLEARGRGVLFDVGHGAGSFSFDVMEKCLAQGFLPDTISSDLHTGNIGGPVYDLPTTLSKFLQLGMSLRDVIERATVNASRPFNFTAEIGTLKPGAEADVAVFDLPSGEFTFTDSYGKTRTGRQKLVPVTTVRGGKVFSPA